MLGTQIISKSWKSQVLKLAAQKTYPVKCVTGITTYLIKTQKEITKQIPLARDSFFSLFIYKLVKNDMVMLQLDDCGKIMKVIYKRNNFVGSYQKHL